MRQRRTRFFVSFLNLEQRGFVRLISKENGRRYGEIFVMVYSVCFMLARRAVGLDPISACLAALASISYYRDCRWQRP
jgi:hypothetical protein